MADAMERLPERIWVERDGETNDKRWFSVAGMGIEYIRADRVPQAGVDGSGVNPAAMTERLIDAAIYNEQAKGGYVAGARKELNEARAAIEAALAQNQNASAEVVGAAARIIDPMAKAPKLDRVTKAVAGAWFGMMRPDGNGALHFGLQQGRPTVEVERSLNILEAHGMVSRTPDEYGGMTYRPLVDMSGYRAAANIALKLTESLAAGLQAIRTSDGGKDV